MWSASGGCQGLKLCKPKLIYRIPYLFLIQWIRHRTKRPVYSKQFSTKAPKLEEYEPGWQARHSKLAVSRLSSKGSSRNRPQAVTGSVPKERLGDTTCQCHIPTVPQRCDPSNHFAGHTSQSVANTLMPQGQGLLHESKLQNTQVRLRPNLSP